MRIKQLADYLNHETELQIMQMVKFAEYIVKIIIVNIGLIILLKQ